MATTALESALMVTNNLASIVRTMTALLLASSLCVASTIPDYPVSHPGDYAVSTRAAGLSIGVQPVEDPKDQETYFRAELKAKGFVPVFVVIQNEASEGSFLFDKTKVTYGPADSTLSTPKTGSRGADAFAAAAIPFVGIFAVPKIISNAAEVQHNLLKKEVQSTTLSPGKSLHGFLYIPVPKDAPREKIHLRVPITRAGADETLVLDLVF
jgi:hypothetical protein